MGLNHQCQCWSIYLPKQQFTCPKYQFGQVVGKGADWGVVVGMAYYAENQELNWTPGWFYDVRLAKGCPGYETSDGRESFHENEIDAEMQLWL